MDRRREPSRKSIIQAALIMLAVVGVLATFAVSQVLNQGMRTAQYQQALERSIADRARIRTIISDLQRAEAAQRGFMLTGDQEFLRAYQGAADGIPMRLRQVRDLSASGAQRARARELEGLVASALADMARGAERRQEFREPGTAYFADGAVGQRPMEEIRSLSDAMIAAEGQQIEVLSASFRRETRRSQAITLGLLAAILILVVGSSAMGVSYLEHRRRAETGLRAAIHQAELASEAKTEFLASMSHEIRTPLTGILGYTELLMNDGLNPHQKRYLERIQVAGSSLLTIVNDILDFSRIEAGEVTLDPHPFAIRAMVDNIVSIISGIAQQKELPIEVRIDDSVPVTVRGDESRLRQILLNLLNNAVKFTEAGRITLTAERDTSPRSADFIRFAVTDTGIGIPEDKRDLLFKRFSQIDASNRREYGGTGLGLAISKRLAELMGGQIGVESTPGEGSTFWVRLPLPETEAEAAEERPKRVAVLRPAHVLLVEDLEQNQELARALLETAGHKVDVVSDGSQAIAAAESGHYDIILMDIQMPVMDGLAATRRIRALDPPTRDVPIIAMTANVLPQQIRLFRDAGMNDHIAKPFKSSEALSKIEKWVPAASPGRPEASAAVPPGPPGDKALDELRLLMGPDWVVSGLEKLLDRLSATFGPDDPGAMKRESLARSAHALVSLSAMLGFPDLSRRCADLENACLDGRELGPAYHEARDAAQRAQTRITAVLQTNA